MSNDSQDVAGLIILIGVIILIILWSSPEYRTQIKNVFHIGQDVGALLE